MRLADTMRAHVLGQWRGCGLGLLLAARRADRARVDVRALARLLAGSGPGLFGDRPCHADVALAATSARPRRPRHAAARGSSLASAARDH